MQGIDRRIVAKDACRVWRESRKTLLQMLIAKLTTKANSSPYFGNVFAFAPAFA